MRYNVEDLVTSVRITLDENRIEQEYIVSEDNNMELNEIIREKLLDAVRSVERIAPVQMLDSVPLVIPEAAQYCDTDGSGYVVLPPDFLRLTLFKMRSWRNPVFDAIGDDTEEARMQYNVYTRGTPIRPVCVLSRDLSGSKILQYYTVGFENNGKYNRRDHRIDRALYLPVPSYTGDNNEELEFNSLLREAIINYTAGLVMVSRREPQMAETFFNIGKSFVES